ncbi:RNA polymerase II-associated [Lactarius pseudohatsudake]|nr:RNA polymerase II-associated [Lactarius pseudohatsudake]
MSSRKSKLDLLVKVRYQNPLPAPPCPPKLLDIPTDPKRYTRPEFLDAATNEALLPMIVDAECGMPLDLGKWEALWEDGADDRALNPDPRNPPLLDPKDQALLLDPAGGTADFGRGNHNSHLNSHSSGTPPVAAHVSWLRKTEYISRDSSAPAHRAAATADPTGMNDSVDVSREAQLASIESSFGAAHGSSDELGTLRHPTKPRLRAVATYEVLPDADVWANAYDLFRFSERPGERGPELDDPRLDCAIMRPMESDGDHFLTYYLTKDDDSAEQFKNSRADPRGVDALQEEEDATEFHFVRDYEVVKVEQEVPNEFLLVFDEGERGDIDYGDGDGDGSAGGVRPAGAYYKLIERKMLLKKKRTEPIERFRDKWALVRVAHVPPSQEEAEERAEALAEVRDPMYLLQSADAEGEDDIDGDADADADAEVVIPAS